MTKETKFKISKHRKFKRIKPKLSHNSNDGDINSETNHSDLNNKIFRKKIRRFRGKKLRKKQKKNKKEKKEKIFSQYFQDFKDIIMNQECMDQIESEEFTVYQVPNTPEENKNYIPLLISESDIILELLDARDVYHSRNKQIEESINNNENKLLLYIITKCDLVSSDYLLKIKNYLQNDIKNNDNINQIIFISSQIRETIKNFFLELQKNVEIMRKKLQKKILRICILGPPNVGKNSLIQSLELFCNTDCTGKYIYFDETKNFCVNSVPGVLFDENEENNFLISKTNKNIKDIKEPKKLINNLMNIVDMNKFKEIYDLEREPTNLDDFVDLIKIKYELKDENMSSVLILEDIVNGKIKYEIELNK